MTLLATPAARRLVLPTGPVPDTLSSAWPAKSAAEVYDYLIDGAKWLAASQRLDDGSQDAIVQAVAAVSGPDQALALSRLLWTATTASYRLAGGTAGQGYTASVLLLLRSGQRLQVDCALDVTAAQGVAPPPPAGTLTVNGFAVSVAGYPLQAGASA